MRLPPTKRARLDLAHLYPPSYFHILTDDGLENILRYVSEHPRSPDWAKYVSAADMRALFKCGGPLSVTARRLLCTFHTSRVKWNSHPEHETSAILSPERLLYHDLFWEGRNTFVDVVVDCDVPFNRFGVAMTKMKRLSVTNSNFRVFHESSMLRGCTLESLELEGAGLGDLIINEIANNCHHLRSLRLTFGFSSLNVARIFESVGSSLEELTLSRESREFDEDYDSELEEECWVTPILSTVARHCKKLRKAKFEGFSFDESVTSDFVRLCAGNREQLHSLELFGPAEENFLKEVSAVCPDLSIMLKWQSGHYKEQLLALGPCAANLVISDTDYLPPFSDTFDVSSARQISARCRNLMEINLNLDSSHRRIYSAFLYFPKPRLEKLNIVFNETNEEFTSSDVLYVLAKLNTIRSLQFTGKVPSAKSVQKVVSANRRLQNIKIRRSGNDCRCRIRGSSNGGDSGPEQFNWIPYAKAMFNGPEVQSVELSCGYAQRVEKFPAFADACILFRRRKFFSITVCGHVYL